jgi:hypothetical protein
MAELKAAIEEVTRIPKVQESLEPEVSVESENITDAEFSVSESASDSEAVPRDDPNYVPEDVG